MEGALTDLRATYGHGLVDSGRVAAARLCYAAFQQKLGPVLGAAGEDLLARTLNLDRALVARRDGRLVGLAGVDLGGRALVGLDWPAVRRAYGLVGGAARYLALAVFDRTAAPAELLMDGIVVSPEARRLGIGSELLVRVVELARDEGCTQVRLDVVDTNPAARRLYERHGFVASATHSLPWLRRWFGFGASTTMIKRLVETGRRNPGTRHEQDAP